MFEHLIFFVEKVCGYVTQFVFFSNHIEPKLKFTLLQAVKFYLADHFNSLSFQCTAKRLISLYLYIFLQVSQMTSAQT